MGEQDGPGRSRQEILPRIGEEIWQPLPGLIAAETTAQRKLHAIMDYEEHPAGACVRPLP